MNIGFAYAAGAAITWGLVYAIDQKILLGVSPVALLFINSIVTAIIMLPLLLLNPGLIESLIHSGKTNLYLILLSLLLAALANYFIFTAIKSVGASSASIIEIAYPFFVVLFTLLIFRTVPDLWFLFGGLLIFIGSAIITYFH